MRRLFTFGCSYTSYSWPTWANLLGLDFDYAENWGLSGIGNTAIAERVTECNVKNKFTKDDVIIIQWSSHLRNDWYNIQGTPDRTNGWKTYGSIFNYHNAALYNKKWIDTFFFEPAYVMHTLNHISMTQKVLESTECTWYMTSIGDIREMGSDMRDKDGYGEKTELTKLKKDAAKKLVWDIVPNLEVYDAAIWGNYKEHWLMPLELFCQTCPELTFDFLDSRGDVFLDLHPSTEQHANWIKQELSNLTLTENTLLCIDEIVENTKHIHKKFKNDKRAFEYALSDKTKLLTRESNLLWPGRPYGY